MTLKTRPDLHYAPLRDGVYVSAGDQEFAMSGWPGFADLMRRCLPLLNRGTGEDELVGLVGTERARPAVRSLLSQLDAHGMVLHLDQLQVPEPDDQERAEHPELLAYLECRSDEPYAAFEQIRGARVLLVGPDEAVQLADRAVRDLGMRGEGRPLSACDDLPTDSDTEYEAAVVVLRRDQAERIPPRAKRYLPVVVGQSAVLVGPLVRDMQDWGRWRGLLGRVLDRPGAPLEDHHAATTIAVSAAVHLLLQDLAGVSGPAGSVVAGANFDVVPFDLPAPISAARAELLLTDASDEPTSAAEVAAWLAPAMHPFLGPATGVDEDSLPQLPVALRRLRTSGGGLLMAHGRDQESATAHAVLELARRGRAGAAAGTSARRWLLDGALRGLSNRAVPSDQHIPEDPELDRLMRALHEASGGVPELAVQHVPGLSWQLVSCRTKHGCAASAWGPNPTAAAQAAVSRVVAALAFGSDGSALLSAIDTDALVTADADSVEQLADELCGWLALHRVRLIGHPGSTDSLVEPAPVWCGRVRLVADVRPHTGQPEALENLTQALTRATGAPVIATLGWQHDRLRSATQRSQADGTPLLPVQISADRITIGPLWSPEEAAGCPACAEIRRRTVADHVLVGDLSSATLPPGTPATSLLDLATQVVRAGRPPSAGEVVIVSSDGVSRHRIVRLPACPWCADEPSADPPPQPNLQDQATREDDPTRVADGTALLAEADLDDRVVDTTYGPVRGILREERMPFAMSMAVLAGAPVMGHGRALSYDQTRSVAVLEAYERLAGFPYEAPLVVDRSFAQVGDSAVDPGTLGQYTSAQLAHASSKVTPFAADLPIDWAWGRDLRSGAARLVPAEVGFYQYDYQFKRDRRASAAAPARRRRRCFLESSSGCALGSTYAEATIHALFEVAERDAFQLAWHRALPLPSLRVDDLSDPVISQLVALIRSRGYDLHLLVATSDIDVPVIWVLATSRTNSFPATFSSAGSGAVPLSAIRSGLREVAQLVTMQLDWTHEDASALVRDPWLVRELEDHVRFSSAPEFADRVHQVLGGPQLSMTEAFADWPGLLTHPSDGIVGTLGLLQDRFAAAGLDQIVIVDQSTREHRDLGLHVVKAVVPGTIPMVFGQAHQRLVGIPRLDRALLQAGRSPAHLDPHPFP